MVSLSEILLPFAGQRLTEWFSDLTELWHNTAPLAPEDHFSPKGMTQWSHYNNYILWHLEDEARRQDLQPVEIVKYKRQIDRYNQQRNDAIERIDTWLETVLTSAGITPSKEVETNSETPGSIIDRLSILTLKIYHWREESVRENVTLEHRDVAKARLHVLFEQLHDLQRSLDKLLLELRQASKRHRVYRQFKMYNDPNLNPAIYKK